MPFLGHVADEERRIESLHQMHLTERESEPAITASVEATAEAMGCPIASVTLIDRDVEIFLAAVGVERCSAPREQAFCAHTIESDNILVVEDAALDERFASNVQVTERGIRFYAGIALHAPDGQRIGALSVRDRHPRILTDKQRVTLQRMAIIVESQLTWCADRWKRVQSQLLLNGVMKSSRDAVLLLARVADKSMCDFQIRSASAAAEFSLDISDAPLRGQLLSRVLGSQILPEDFQRLLHVLSTGESGQFELECRRQGRLVWLSASVARWHDGLAMTLHDITEQKRIASQLDDVLAMSRDLMCVIDSQGRYVRTNHAFEQLLGVSPGSLIRRSVLQFVDARDVDRTRQILEKLVQGQPISLFENQLVDHKGQRHWIQWRAQAIEDNRAIFAVGRDVTEHRLTHQLLKQSERFARSIIDTLSESIAIIDPTGMILNVNRTWKQFAQDNQGEPAKLCEGANYLGVCHHSAERGDADAAIVLQGITGVLSGAMESFEHTYRCDSPDESRWFVLTANHLDFDHRRCAVISHHNITQRKQAEQKLQQTMIQLDRQAAVVANSLDGIVKATPEGQLLYLNRAARKLIGLAEDDPLPNDVRQCLSPESIVLLDQTVIPTTIKLGQWSGEMVATQMQTGRMIPVHVASFAVPKPDGMGIDCLAAIFHDISREKQATHELEQARLAAESAHHARSVLLANLGNKIRSPMTAILGYSDLLSEPNLSPSDRTNHLHIIRRSARQLLALLNDLLDLSSIEAGRMVLHPQPISTERFLAELMETMRVHAIEKNLEMSLQCVGPLPRVFNSDALRLRQILANLINNAIEFTGIGGVRLLVSSETRGDRLLMSFAVTDTGIGMHPDQVAALFQPFCDAGNSLTAKQAGSGLTLLLCQRLAHLMSGHISVESQLGHGSTFTLTLDIGPACGVELSDVQMSSLAASRAESLNDAATSQGPQMPLPPKLLGRVLLADAGPGNDPLIRFYLHRMGLTTDSVTGCTQTVEHMLAAVKLSDPYRLLVLDVQGAEMSGLQVVRMLRDAGHAGPIIAVTAQDAKDDRETCLASGCDDYVTRPIDRARFEQVVTRWLQGVVSALDPG